METENPNQEHPNPAQPDRNGSEGARPSHDSAPFDARRDRPYTAPPTKRPAGRKTWPWVLCVLLLAGAAVYFLFFKPGESKPQQANNETVTVGAAKVVRQDMYNEVPIPAEFRPYVQSQLHAIVTGYVETMLVDFGDKVKKGQVLATLNVPELQDQLNNAKANQQQAEADYNNEHLLFTRLEQVN